MRKILIVGDANLQHTVNFIDILLGNDSENIITVFNTKYEAGLIPEIKKFYLDKEIEVINAKNLSQSRNRKIRAALNLIKMGKVLLRECRNNKQYDMCFILYCSWQSAIWLSQYHKFFKKVILVYFGSDVLRNRRLNNRFFNKMNSEAEYIILPNLNTLKVFNEKTRNNYEGKSYVIQYPQKMVANMLAYQPLQDRNRDRELFGLPNDKLIILCGHTATTAEQYEEIISNLSKCRRDVLDKCFFVFMMTYAPEDCIDYQNKISKLLAESNLEGKVLKSRINYKDMPKLHYACDMHITMIKTDAFSCFLQEEMLAGNILVYGKWLNYFEIENDSFFTFPINTVSELCDTVNNVIDHIQDNIEKSKHNVRGIVEIASEEAIRDEWNRIVFGK